MCSLRTGTFNTLVFKNVISYSNSYDAAVGYKYSKHFAIRESLSQVMLLNGATYIIVIKVISY